MAKTISSTFGKNAQGWTIAGDVQSSGWQSTGGDPGGYFGWVDAATGQDSYYQASAAYLGDKGAYDGGTLSYDILDTGNGYTTFDVQLAGAGFTLQYTNPNDSGFPTPNTWSPASVKLIASNFIDTATGTAPSKAEMKSVLQDLTQLEIRAEFVNGAESGGIDNVTLAPPSHHAPASPATTADMLSLAHHAGPAAPMTHWIS